MLYPYCGCAPAVPAPTTAPNPLTSTIERSLGRTLAPTVTPQVLAAIEERTPALLAQAEFDPLAGILQTDDPEQQRLALERLMQDADAESYRRSFRSFTEDFWQEIDPRPYEPNRATDALIDHLQAVGDGQLKMLGIACSPGIGKTSVGSVLFPAWLWVRENSRKLLCASHTDSLVREIAVKFQRLVESDRFLSFWPACKLVRDATSAMHNAAHGVRYGRSCVGSVTGFRASGAIIDDSIDAKKAFGPENVRDVNRWLGEVLGSRIDDRPDRFLLGIQQRLAKGDMIDWFRDLGAEILELSARYDSKRRCVTSVWSDPRTFEGEILAPTIHSDDYLEEKLKFMGPHAFATQYQQLPSTREGNAFKIALWNWFTFGADDAPKGRPDGSRTTPAFKLGRRGDGALDIDWVCVSMDPTGGSLKNDASAVGLGILAGKDLRRFVLEDLTPGPRTLGQQCDDLVYAVRRAGELCGFQRLFKVLIEKKALGVGAFDKIEAALQSGELVYPDGSPIKAEVKLYEPSGKGSKEARADHLEPDMRAGLIYLLDGAPWVPAWVEEFALFPRGQRDDRVDVLAQGCDEYKAHVTPPTANQWANAFKALTRLGRF